MGKREGAGSAIQTGRVSLWEYSNFKTSLDNIVEDGVISPGELQQLRSSYAEMNRD